MRILRIYPFLPPLRGGMEKHVLRLTEEQRKLGCEVVIAFNQGNSTAATDIQVLAAVNLRRIKPQVLRDMIFYFFLFTKLFSQRRSYDVVHVHGDWSAFVFGHMIAVFLKARMLVASLHSIAKKEWVYQLSLSGYDLLYCTGAQDAARLASLSNISVHWQHSGIDSVYINTKKRSPSQVDVIWVGSFVPVKNIPLILDIAERMPDVTFQLVGDGPQREFIADHCRKKHLENITLIPFLAPLELSRKLSRASVFLLTSFVEGTPTAVLEAMACGLAVVTSESNNYSQLLTDGKNGYVVQGFDSWGYELKIRLILQDSKLLEDISKRNKIEAVSFGWPKVAGRITEWMRLGGS